MEYQLHITHTAANEAGTLAFLTYVKDNHATEVHQASADSTSLACSSTLVLASLADCVTAVTGFKAQFTITYKLYISNGV